MANSQATNQVTMCVPDIVMNAIRTGHIQNSNVSFDMLRSIAGRDRDCWHQLGRGRNILCTQKQLDQYLYSYGPMTKSQWQFVLPGATIPKGAIRILDYGCGQGLASILLFDILGKDFVNRVESVVLVEPSGIALERARSVLGCYLGMRPVIAIQKKLDAVTPQELRTAEGTTNLHLMSNVLDIGSFQHISLFRKMLMAKGHHSLLAVSHHRDFHGGSERFKQLESYIRDKKHRAWFSLESSRIEEFYCQIDRPAISLEFHVEVLHGSI